MKTRWIRWMWIGAVVLAAGSLQANAGTVHLRAAGQKPHIDGVLSEALWQGEPDCADFVVFDTDDTPARNRTQAWLAHDARWLYAAFRCRFEAGMSDPAITERDAYVHRDPSVELFLSPGTDGRTYHHFIVSASGLQGDNRAVDRNPVDWDGFWLSAARIHADGGLWTAELAIPLFYLTQDDGTAAWRVNVCRNHASNAGRELSSWSPTRDSFHNPASFGTLTGLEDVQGEPMFAPVVRAVEVGPLVDIPRRFYQVRAQLENTGAQDGTVDVYAIDTTSEGTTETPKSQVKLAAGHRAPAAVDVDVEKILVRETVFAATCDTEVGTWQWRHRAAEKSGQEPFTTAVRMSYYTDEPSAELVYRVNFPAAALQRCSVKVTSIGAQEADLAVRPAPLRTGLIPFPIQDLPAGEHAVSAAVVSDEGTVMARHECALVKKAAPASGNLVRTDRWNRCLDVNGEPFFAFGFIGITEAGLPLAREIGCNFNCLWSPPDPGYMAAMARQDIRAAISPWAGVNRAKNAFKRSHTQEAWDNYHAEVMDQFASQLDAYAQHPSLVLWNHYDEPGYDLQKESMPDFVRLMEQKDGYHPVVQLFCGSFRNVPAWMSYWEGGVGVIDIYSGVDFFVDHIEPAGDLLEKLRRPFWVVPLGDYCSGSRYFGQPSEVKRVQAYLALIHGATGLYYFRWPPLHIETFNDYKRLAAEARALSPALLAHKPECTLTWESISHKDALHASWRRMPGRGYVLLAANVTNRPVDAVYRLPFLPDGTEVTRMFGEGAYTLRDRSFSETLEPLATRAYFIAREEARDRPVELLLSAKQLAAPDEGATANLIHNPGFETVDAGWTVTGSAAATYDAGQGRSGERSLKIRMDRANLMAFARGDAIALKPSTEYRIQAWARGALDSQKAQPSLRLYNPDTEQYTYVLNCFVDRGWRHFDRTFTAPDRAQTVQPCLVAGNDAFRGAVWFDDVSLEEIPKEAISKNLLANSSFEYAKRKDCPDHWGSLSWLEPVRPDQLGGMPNAFFAQDSQEAYEGEYSLRLQGMHQLKAWPTRRTVRVDPDKTYVFSIYLKAQKPGTEVWLRCDNTKNWETFEVGTEWKRYHVTGKGYKDGGGYYLLVSLRTEGAAGLPTPLRSREGHTVDKATYVWLDAAQVEEGSEPTAYVRDAYVPGQDYEY